MELLGIFIAITGVVIPIITLTYIIIAAVNHEKKQRIHTFELSIRSVCLYLVIIITLGGFVAGSIVGVNRILNYFYPEVDQTRNIAYSDPDVINSKESVYKTQSTEKEDTSYIALQTEYEQKTSLVECATAFTFSIASLVVFMIYNKKALELRKESIEIDNEDNKKEEKTVEKEKVKKEVKTNKIEKAKK